jgi:thiamine biosynthesis lipoprotein
VRWATRLVAVLCAAGCVATAALELVHRDVYLMGTRARLTLYAADRDRGFASLERALGILEHTERELSTWRQDSDISRLNRAPVGTPWMASPELCQLFEELYEWRGRTEGAFDPGVGRLTAAWGTHESGRIPSDSELTTARQHSGLDRITFSRAACTLTRTADLTIDVGAFGKGAALDRVARDLTSTPWMIDLGGHVSVGGPPPAAAAWDVDIAHPVERDRPLMQLRMRSGSLSTSGSSERDLIVNGARVGHILDPRNGRPAAFSGSVVVWHERGLVADILSTALYVMGPDAGLRWAGERGFAASYLVPRAAAVDVRSTAAFKALFSATTRR